MTKLSKREKVLLYVLGIAVIIAAMVMLVIQPATKRNSDLSAQLAAQQMQENSMQQMVAGEETVRAQIAEYDRGIVLEKAFYLPAMTSDDLDKYITGMLQKYGLVAQSLLITEVETDTGTEEEDEDAAPAQEEDIHIYKADVVAAGTINQFVDLTESVGETDGIRMGAFSLKPLVTPKPTPTPKPTKTPWSKRTPRPTKTPRGMTPTPIPPTPAPTPANPSYTASVTFFVLEYGQIAGVSETAAAATPMPEGSAE